MPSARTARFGQPLSAREIDIVTAVAKGLTNAAIGKTLELSTLTVKSHLRRIGVKLGTGDRAGIVGAAIRTGQLDLGAPAAIRSRVPVICSCSRCREQLAAGRGMAARITRLVLPDLPPSVPARPAQQFGRLAS